jgi:hypothetical protein
MLRSLLHLSMRGQLVHDHGQKLRQLLRRCVRRHADPAGLRKVSINPRPPAVSAGAPALSGIASLLSDVRVVKDARRRGRQPASASSRAPASSPEIDSPRKIDSPGRPLARPADAPTRMTGMPGVHPAKPDAYRFSSAATAASAAWKPIFECVPSQKGLLTEAPHRHSEIAGLPCRSNSLPL